jgi:hypothetical protein
MSAGNNIWAALRQGVSAGVMAGGFPYARNNRYIRQAGAPSFGLNTVTIQESSDLLESGDVMFLGPTEYNENVVVSGKQQVTIIGGANPYSCRVTGLTNGTALTIDDCSDVLLVNLNLEGRGTGGGLQLTGQIRRVTAIGCKFHGGANAVFINPGAGGQLVDLLIKECEIALATNGIVNTVGGGDPTHRIKVLNSLFYGITTDCIVSSAGAINTAIMNNIFGTNGDAEPTRFIKLDGAGDSGIVAGNQFATPTNANTKFVLDADVMWGANATEAGWSTARPA